MIREHLFHKRAAADAKFRWRGGDVSRVEGFSDGVFALTLTLLVVTSTIPATFHELFLVVRDLPVAIVTFALITLAWHYHYLFFRRYGLEDGLTIALNAVFLFLVVFFAYPLRFLATFLWYLVLGEPVDPLFAGGEGWTTDALSQRVWMMYFYGAGIAGVFGVLTLMTWRALRLRAQLELDELEVFLTRTSMAHFMVPTTVALVSIATVAATSNPGLGGVLYFTLGPLHFVVGVLCGTRADRLHKQLLAGGGEGT